ncbi:MAG: hypothetical protein JXA13_06005 [Anaerolineales bacterium]|nr:hypothetical protein [Anaerolineales bacterium]
MKRFNTLLFTTALLSLSACSGWRTPLPTAAVTASPALTPSAAPTVTQTLTPTITPTATLTATPTPIVVRTPPAGLFFYPTRLIYPVWGEIEREQWLRRTVWTKDLAFSYNGGQVLLAGAENGINQIFIDDALRISIVHPDASQGEFYFDVTWDCQYHRYPAGPFDLTSYFKPGKNLVHVELIDMCPSGWGTDGIYLVEFR